MNTLVMLVPTVFFHIAAPQKPKIIAEIHPRAGVVDYTVTNPLTKRVAVDLICIGDTVSSFSFDLNAKTTETVEVTSEEGAFNCMIEEWK